MDRSPGFASAARDSCRPVRTRCRCGWLSCFASPRTATRWLILQKARRHGSCPLRLLVGARFQVLFHSPPGVLFTFPSRYWFAIGHRRVFSIGGWSPRIRAGFHVSGPTRVPRSQAVSGSRTGLSPPSAGLPMPFRSRPALQLRRGARAPRTRGPTTPRAASPLGFPPARVCAGARSLAATSAISFDFSSSGYLDVSVPRVAPRPLCVQGRASGHGPARVPPFGYPRIDGCVPLPADYRSLPRPSSASCAKASAVRP